MASEVLVICRSREALKWARFATTFKSFSLTALGRMDPPTEAEGPPLLEQLRESLGPDFRGQVVSVIDPDLVSARTLSFPFHDPRRLESAVQFELESQLPVDMEEVAATWQQTERSEHGSEAFVVVAPRTQLIASIAEFSALSLEPRAVLVGAAALADLTAPTSADPVGVLALGSDRSEFAIGRNGQVIMARILRAGGNSIDRAIAKRFSLPVDQAKKAKENEARWLAEPFSDGERATVSAIEEGLAPLVSHLLATLKALPSAMRPNEIQLTGGASRLPGLTDYLQLKTGLSVSLLDLQAALGQHVEASIPVEPEFAIPIAVGVAFVRRSRAHGLNFRRGELAYRGRAQANRGILARVAVGIGGVFFAAGFSAYAHLRSVNHQIESTREAVCASTKAILGTEICDPTAALATLQQLGGGGGVILPSYAATDVFVMMSKVVDDSLDVTLEELDIKVNGRPDEPDRVAGKGEAADFESTERFITLLQSDKCVTEASVSRQRRGRTSGRVEFSFDAELTCPAGIRPGEQQTPVAPAEPTRDGEVEVDPAEPTSDQGDSPDPSGAAP